METLKELVKALCKDIERLERELSVAKHSCKVMEERYEKANDKASELLADGDMAEIGRLNVLIAKMQAEWDNDQKKIAHLENRLKEQEKQVLCHHRSNTVSVYDGNQNFFKECKDCGAKLG